MVAARRLRKSMLKDNNLGNISNIDFNIYSGKSEKNRYKDDIYVKDNLGTFEEDNKSYFRLKTRFIIKIFLAISIVFSCLVIKLLFAEQAKSNKYINHLINEYNKDYTKYGCIEKFEDIVNNVYDKTKYIIPEALANDIREKYLLSVKPKIIDFQVISVFNNIISTTNSESDITNESKEIQENQTETNTEKNSIQNTGMGGGGPVEVSLEIEDSSSVSTMQDNVSKILSKNIEIRKPVDGTLTSVYGAREQIFEGVNSYHTGIDIANKMSTPIYSATCGEVIKAEENNKYYGNNIEIEKDGVIFKYAHMEKLYVSEGDEVDFDTMIGYMGSTGMSTGSHLHFEIKIDGESVDPRQIVSFY